NPLGQSTSLNYDFNTGELASTTDPNGRTTSFAYDAMWRRTQANYPDGGQTLTCYSDEGTAAGGNPGCAQSGPPFQVVTTQKLNSSQNRIATSVFDGLGRMTQTQINTDPDCPSGDKTDTGYDAL